MSIKYLDGNKVESWDNYVMSHPAANLYHLSGWRAVVEKTYGLKTYYLMAIKGKDEFTSRDIQGKRINLVSGSHSKANGKFIAGILPLVYLKHIIFDNSLISLPFFDCGGILADNPETERELSLAAIKLGSELRVKRIELRHLETLPFLTEGDSSVSQSPSYKIHQPLSVSWTCETHSDKVRMLLDLPESSEVLMKSFKSKLRSQIRRPLKEDLYPKVGGLKLLDDFYKVFSENMRDLGSPVHSKALIRSVLHEFPEKTRIVVVYKDSQPLACSLIVGFKDTLLNPWASALKEYNRLSPNMLLYWTMLEYACDNGFRYFDFGRSSPDEGTFRFKKQWGSKPKSLHWHYILLDGRPLAAEAIRMSRFDKAIQYWQKLPLPITKFLGPRIRKHIGL